MGVLAVGVGKAQEALPFFKKALEANSSVAQFWLSYIEVLIKLNRMDEANSLFEKAKSKGITGDGFELLGEKLNEVETTFSRPKSENLYNPEPPHSNYSVL